MVVTKRDGTTEEMQFDKICDRIRKVSFGFKSIIDPQELAIKIIDSLYDGVSTSQIDSEISQLAASMVTVNPDYAQLAANIAVSNLHKNVTHSFAEGIETMYNYVNPKNQKHSPIVSKELYELVEKNAEVIEATIDYDNDYNYDYFGFKTLEKSYLLKVNGKIFERPQDMLMRVSLGIHGYDLDNAFATYHMMSKKYFTHATPTLFNSGTPMPQMSSCFLIDMEEDSLDGIYNTLKTCAMISGSAGGIGFTAHKIRSTGSYITGTNGVSNGLVPMLRVFNDTARYVDQGGGKRKGSFAVYLEPWHADIYEFLDLKKNHGKEEVRARDLFYAMWINDEFMHRVKADEMWSLMSPSECPGLDELYGEAFQKAYRQYEAQGKFVKQVKARDLWEKILISQMETGTPYMLYKDAANEKSNQKNLGTIKSSNLCAEILEYTSPGEVAVCNLASIALPMFVEQAEDGTYYINHRKLYSVAYQATYNLNRVIDRNYYPVWQAETSNFKHRPIGLGIQGLADMFMKMRLPFESDEAKQLNKDVHETIYYASLKCSNDLAKKEGAYQTFKGSPLSEGRFQFDLWGVSSRDLSGRWDWNHLRADIRQNGVRNSLVTALMPTASTGQILGNNECFEPYTSNIYTRRVLSGEFIVVNKFLIEDLLELGLWDDNMRQQLMAANGSVQGLDIPDDMKQLYKTVWEMSMKNIIDMSVDRGLFVDQSQSLNLFIQDPDLSTLTSMHFYTWQKGLKTGMYYLRSKSAVNAKQFTLDVETTKKPQEDEDQPMSTEEFRAMIQSSKQASEEGDDCLMCGS
jgi:ribonucleoside-diphosphate reductase alpha chain